MTRIVEMDWIVIVIMVVVVVDVDINEMLLVVTLLGFNF